MTLNQAIGLVVVLGTGLWLLRLVLVVGWRGN